MSWPVVFLIVEVIFLGTFIWVVNILRSGFIKSLENGFDKAMKEAERKSSERSKEENVD